MKNLLSILLFIMTFNCYSQKLTNSREDIDKAQKTLNPLILKFYENIVGANLDSNIQTLLNYNNGNLNPYEKYIIGCTIYDIDVEKSFKLIEEAYNANPNQAYFNYEYALALQRKKEFEKSKPLFEKYSLEKEADFRTFLYLSECEFNLGNIKKGVEYWSKVNHPKNHIGIDNALHVAHSRGDQLKKRSGLLKEIRKGNFENVEELLMLDYNWELDWWNKQVQKYFLEYDLNLIKEKLGEKNELIKLFSFYDELRNASMPRKETYIPKLQELGYFVDNKPIPKYKKVSSQILSLCLSNYIIEPREFYKSRKDELVPLTKATNDVEFLNILAFLQATIEEKVKPEIDKLGWKEYKDERFATSFLTGQADKRCTEKELKEAINDFPESSMIQCFELDCVKKDKKEYKRFLTEIIKKEFCSLKADRDRFSYSLKGYIAMISDL